MKNKLSPGLKLAMLGCIFGVGILFYIFVKGTSVLASKSYYGIAIVILLGCTIFTAVTSAKLYDYFDAKHTFVRFIPCLCELTLIDYKLRKIALVLYVVAAGLGIIMWLDIIPGVSTPFYVALVMLAVLAAIQVVKGIGLRAAYLELEAGWKKISGHTSGPLKFFIIFGYLPFLRIYLIYCINKLLMTLVTFGGLTSMDAEADRDTLSVSEDK